MASNPVESAPAVIVKNKGLLTVAIMLATVMQVLDTTIANVALPHMSASLGAAQHEITWVLTSYIVASAIATPVTGWMSDRIGQKTLFLAAIAGFTLASALCGMATSLGEMVAFRIMQGLCGAMIAPLAQTVILNINPKERVAQAMAIYGIGVMVAPIVGPTLGGWLTESVNWRWVFLVNIPVGLICIALLIFNMPNSDKRNRRFDFFGFAMLALGIGALQLMLDRGSDNDWFQSTETWIELAFVVSGLWVYLIHSLTAESPFVDLRIFKDRNFALAAIFMFLIGMTMFSALALLPPLLQNFLGYPVITSGELMAPRGATSMISMMIIGRFGNRIDTRFMMLFGATLMTAALYMMTGFNLQMDSHMIIITGALQGVGMGFIFVPLSALAFSTLSTKLRGDATSMYALVRNLGQGIGVSMVSAVLANMMQINHSELAERLTVTSKAVHRHLPGLVEGTASALHSANALVTQQAAILSYIDDFWLMTLLSTVSVPLLLLLRKPKPGAARK
ncbi:DHA2 family efflux MFS transporter permease subunit [uncultured Cohaesibacter sp.]|uniref:DHA2 family efflux MFS transporter permease subunit n=1 Tax=uncultured Cohaesibacter sp. TaxID=1002546 RepID=UPI0029C8106F|nr:DHA2 family efflux MFS transporter permease subunit [uncultured Cohaesibacter sp.]